MSRAVLVQMTYYQYDNSYMLDIIRKYPSVFRGIAVADWTGRHVDREMQELAGLGVRGFRVYAEGELAATCLKADVLEKMFRCGAQQGLVICLLITPDSLPAVTNLCKRYPDTPVVIDHLGQVGFAGRILEEDTRGLCALAKYPLVKVKVSAFYALGAKRPPYEDLAPLFRRVYDAFGPQRLMWGSDCPFQLANGTYEDSIALVRDHVGFLSEDDKEWILCRTAESTFFR